MKIEGDGQRLRAYVCESDRWEGKPLFEAIVHEAKDRGLAGATVLRAMEGFGAKHQIHSTKVLRLSDDLPLIVEIVDKADKISAFVDALDAMVEEGMITLEPVRIIAYRHK